MDISNPIEISYTGLIRNYGYYKTENDYLYEGEPVKPINGISYIAGNREVSLEEGIDYSIKYSNNNEPGRASATISGLGFFTGSRIYEFNIVETLQAEDITIEYNSTWYDGTEKRPAVTVKKNGCLLRENEDYILNYANNIDAGRAQVTVTGIGKYRNAYTYYYDIQKKLVSLENADIKLKNTIYTYDGSPKKPTVEVTLNGQRLNYGVDYVLSYRNNINDGTAYVYVTGIGDYTGTESISFAILSYNSGMDAVYDDGTLVGNNLLYGITDDENNEVEVICPAKKNLSKVTIPATVTSDGITYKVTSIGNKAFYKNVKLKSVTVGNNVTSIENYAFYGCKNMSTLKIGSRVSLIGASTFRKCTKLTSVTLPVSMNTLGKNAFYGCTKLKSITLNSKSVVDINVNAIKGISKRATIKVPKKYLNRYKKKFNSKTGYKKTMKIRKK